MFKKGDRVIFAGKTGTITEVTEGARYPYRVVFDDESQGIYAASELRETGGIRRVSEHLIASEQAKVEVSKRLALWIDSGVIAVALVNALSEVVKPEEVTFENAKLIYYNFLETELTDALRRSVNRAPHIPFEPLRRKYE